MADHWRSEAEILEREILRGERAATIRRRAGRHLAVTDELVRRARHLIAQQAQTVSFLQRTGRDTREASMLLDRFEEALAMHIARRDRLLRYRRGP